MGQENEFEEGEETAATTGDDAPLGEPSAGTFEALLDAAERNAEQGDPEPPAAAAEGEDEPAAEDGEGETPPEAKEGEEGEEGEGEGDEAGPDMAKFLDGKALTDDVAEKLQVMVPVGGEERLVSVKEAAKGYMRQSDYTRGKQSVREEKQQNDAEMEEVKASFEAWREDPLILEYALDRLGMPVEDMARQVLARKLEEAETPENMRHLAKYARDKQLDEAKQRLSEKLKSFRKQGKQAPSPEVVQQMQQDLNAALSKHDLKWSAAIKRRMHDHMATVWDEGRPATAQDFLNAAQAVREDLEDEAKQYAASKNPPKQQAPAKPPTPSAASRGAKPAGKPRSQRRPKVTAKSFDEYVDGLL